MSAPLTPDEFSSLMAALGPFEPQPRIAVAVSGGADSLALGLLAHGWAKARGGHAIGVTVDHALRPDSAAEARQVGEWLAARGMDHVILRWDGPKPSADVQAEARAARYRLLEQWAAGQGILHVLLAHHRDDQAETMLLRLGRGSGVDGLSAMAAVQEGFSVRWLRPCLPVSRARLAAMLTATGQDWVEDPSNRNAKFARVRIRQLLPHLAEEGLSPARLADTARRMGRARHALEQAVADAAARWVRPDPAGFLWAEPATFRDLPEEVALRLLVRLLLCAGGGDYVPRAERSESLLQRLRAGLPKAVTLAGCRIAPCKGKLLFCREAGRMAGPVALVPGTELVWDGRFRVKVAADAPEGLTLEALGAAGWGEAAQGRHKVLSLAIPAPARASLPAIRRQDTLCAVPHLGYNRTEADERTLQWIIAAPPNPLTVAGHCLV